MKRFVSIWFRHLTTDRLILRQPRMAAIPFVLAAPERGRMVVKAANSLAERSGVRSGMVVADARAILPALLIVDHHPGQAEKSLKKLAEWALRYTPIVAIDLPDGLVLDATGCTHLWGSEPAYVKDISTKLQTAGYDVRIAMADTISVAWAVSRYAGENPIVQPDEQAAALLALPPAALRLDAEIISKMSRLGFYQIRNFIYMPSKVLRRRFGQALPFRIGQALGHIHEPLEPIIPDQPYQERLPCLEPICTATGIRIALRRLLEPLCKRLVKEGKGLRKAVFKGFRVDGNIQQIEIGTNGASASCEHLFSLFDLKIGTIRPDLGIDLFLLEAPVTEILPPQTETLWSMGGRQKLIAIAELLDRLAGRAGANIAHRYLPAEHYWPERSIQETDSLQQTPSTRWRTEHPRPVHLLPVPEKIEVTAPIPDYPPMIFLYRGKIYKICKADGPERIEQEWWLQQGLHRDYYSVEDETGGRFWIFRLGHYDTDINPEWFIHGFFA